MIRAIVAFVVLTVLLAVPALWASPDTQSILAISAALTLMIALFLAALWVMEKVSPAPHEPFHPRQGHAASPSSPAMAKRRRNAA